MITSKTSELSSQVNDGNQINLSFQYHNKKIITFLNSLVSKILSRNNIVFLQSTLMTILRELIINAVKANSKRVYFQTKNLDIRDLEQYEEGMENFKEYIVKEREACENELKQSELKVNIQIQKLDNGIQIDVINNVKMLDDEVEKLISGLKKLKNITTFQKPTLM